MVNTGQFNNLGLLEHEDIQSSLLTAIARSAETLTNGKGWPDGLNELLESLGKITKVSKVWIFQTIELTDEYIIQDYAFEWASQKKYKCIDLPYFNMFKTNIDEPDYKKMIKSRLLGEYQNMIISELKPSYIKSVQEKQNVKSALTIPIFVENKWWGTLGFDDCERENRWSDSQIALLRMAGYFIASAILKDKLSSKRKQLDILQQITEYSVWEFDLNRKYLWCTSKVFTSLSNKTDNLQFPIKNMLKIIHPNDRIRLYDKTKEYIKNKTGRFRCDIRILSKSNEYRWVELIGTIDNDSKDNNNKLIGVVIDITNRKQAENQLQIEATIDPLTRIFNRRKLEQILKNQLNVNKQKVFSFLMIDIDFFKKINDTYGHPVGDKILIHIVNICKKNLNQNDTLARIGGEEFAILLPKTNKKDASMIAHKIKEQVKNIPFLHKNEHISCTVSIGCMTSDNKITKISEIYKLADLALYRSKESGRDLVSFV